MRIPDAVLARLPRSIGALPSALKRSTLTAVWRRVDVTRLEGVSAANGRRATVVIAARFASANFILDRLFDGPVRETSLGRCWLGALPGRLAAAEADLTIARVAIGVGGWLFDTSYLRLPEMVDSEIVVPTEGERWPRKKSARSNQRRVAENGLTWSTTTDPKEFDRFYTDFYVPFVRGKFGQRSYPVPRTELRYQFAHGCLQWVNQGDRTIAGQLLVIDPDCVRCAVLGLVGDGTEANALGAGAATTLFAVEYAQQHAIPRVSLGASFASLCDPLLLSKRYWGFEFKPRRRATHDLLIHWPTWNPTVEHLLAEIAPIARDGNRLLGLTCDLSAERLDEAALRQAGRKLGADGLAVLGVVGKAGDGGAGARIVDGHLPIVALRPGSSQAIHDALLCSRRES